MRPMSVFVLLLADRYQRRSTKIMEEVLKMIRKLAPVGAVLLLLILLVTDLVRKR